MSSRFIVISDTLKQQAYSCWQVETSSGIAMPAISVIVNESLARKLGWEEPIGETLRLYRKQLTVIGVVRDFHFRSLHHAIGPAVLQLQATSSSTKPRRDYRYLLMIRIRPENVHDTLDFLREKWREVVQDSTI